MKYSNKFIQISYSLIILLALSSCSFKKDKDDNKATETIVTANKADTKTVEFCSGFSSQEKISYQDALILSLSNQTNDLCNVLNYISSLDSKDITPADLEVFENFTLTIKAVIKDSDKKSFEKVLNFINSFSASNNGVAADSVVMLNNLTKNFGKNRQTIPFIKDHLEILLNETDNMAIKEFEIYWQQLQDIIGKSELCNSDLIFKILKRKSISPHMASIANSCHIVLTASQVMDARSSFAVKVTDLELRFFQSSIKSKFFSTEIPDSNAFRRTLSTAVVRNDKNLFRLMTTLDNPPDFDLSYLIVVLHTDIEVDPFFTGLRSSDLNSFFQWKAFSKVINDTEFPRMLNILSKNGLFPNESQTREIATGIIQDRSPTRGILLKNSNILSLFKYLRSVTTTKFRQLSQEDIRQNELDLLTSGVNSDGSIYSYLSYSQISQKIFSLNVTSNGHLIINEVTDSSGLFISGDIYEKIFITKDFSPVKNDTLFYYVDQSGATLVAPLQDFLKSVNNEQPLDQIQIKCNPVNMTNSCDEMKVKYDSLFRATIAALAKKAKATSPMTTDKKPL